MRRMPLETELSIANWFQLTVGTFPKMVMPVPVDLLPLGLAYGLADLATQRPLQTLTVTPKVTSSDL